MRMKKILFIAHHRIDRAPGQRYRFEQYFSYLEGNGVVCDLKNIISEEDDKILYSHGNYLKKAVIGLKSLRKRKSDLKSISQYDLVVVFREAILTSSIFFERKLAKSGVPILFDFDDAIWVKDVSEGNQRLSFLKNPDKIKKILPLVSHVSAGNSYLKKFALKYNKSVSIMPSTIDTDKYKEIKKLKEGPVTIGWVGSHTTIKHFETIVPVLIKLKKKYKGEIEFKVIGDPIYRNSDLGINGIAWDNSKEVEFFNMLDIGVMPLPDDEWTKGKCGMKGLLYMSVNTPAVMSSVGMNSEIIENGVNGFLADTKEEWFEVLSKLIEDENLRKSIGLAGRKTVEEKYSMNSQKEKYLDLYLSLMK
jgi:glycosyltransferase involved in cell wall biosynthesis